MNLFFWANYLTGEILFIGLIGIFLTFVLTPRFKSIPKILCACIPMIAEMIPTYVRIAYPDSKWFGIMGNLQMIIIASYLIFFFSDKWWRKLFILLLIMLDLELSEAFAMEIGYGSIAVEQSFSFDSYEMFIHQSLTYIISLIIFMAIWMIWINISKHDHMSETSGVFLLFPLGQLLLFWNLPEKMINSGQDMLDGISILGLISTFLADIVAFYVLLSSGEKESMKRQLIEMQHLYDIERQHYENVERTDRAIAKIRHDLRNQLAVISNLMNENAGSLNTSCENSIGGSAAVNENYARAREMINQIVDNVQKAQLKKWCDNSIANAVISEKASICKEENIKFDSEIQIGELEAVKPVHICSVFSNLIDNAIAGASESSSANRIIKLSGRQEGDYLQIKVCNTAQKPEKKSLRASTLELHGHGQEILRDIAKQYDGSFLTDWKDGIYTAQIALDLKKHE